MMGVMVPQNTELITLLSNCVYQNAALIQMMDHKPKKEETSTNYLIRTRGEASQQYPLRISDHANGSGFYPKDIFESSSVIYDEHGTPGRIITDKENALFQL